MPTIFDPIAKRYCSTTLVGVTRAFSVADITALVTFDVAVMAIDLMVPEKNRALTRW